MIIQVNVILRRTVVGHQQQSISGQHSCGGSHYIKVFCVDVEQIIAIDFCSLDPLVSTILTAFYYKCSNLNSYAKMHPKVIRKKLLELSMHNNTLSLSLSCYQWSCTKKIYTNLYYDLQNLIYYSLSDLCYTIKISSLKSSNFC